MCHVVLIHVVLIMGRLSCGLSRDGCNALKPGAGSNTQQPTATTDIEAATEESHTGEPTAEANIGAMNIEAAESIEKVVLDLRIPGSFPAAEERISVSVPEIGKLGASTG